MPAGAMAMGVVRRLLATLLALILIVPITTGLAEVGPGEIVVAADGTGDATTLREALSLVEAGGSIRLAPGTYDGGVIIAKDLHISGAEDGSSVVLVGEGPPLSTQASDVTIRHITVKSREGTSPPTGVLVGGGSVLVEACSISGVEFGIQIMAGAQAEVRDCTIEHASASAILVDGPGTAAVITGNEVVGGNWGIHVEDGAEASVRENDVTGQENAGILVVGAAATATLRDNDVSDNGWGIEALSGASVDITGNRVFDQKETGIYAGGASQVSLRDNELRGNESGVIIGDGANATIEANSVVGHEATGILVTGSTTSATVRDNDVADNGSGIEALSGASASITGNRVSGHDTGIYVGGAGEVSVHDNELADNEWGITVVDGAAPSVKGNVLSDHETTAISIEGAGTSPTVRDNRISGGQWGYWVGDEATPDISGGSITDAETGIEFQSAGGRFGDSSIVGGKWSVYLMTASTPAIEDNSIQGPANIGITALGADTTARITRNAIELDGDAWGILIDDDAHPSVSDNTISGGEIGVNVNGADAVLTGNAVSGADFGVSVQAESTATIAEQRLSANGIGIDISGSGTAPGVRDNAITGSTLGIRVSDGAAPSIDGNELTYNETGIDIRDPLTAPTVRGNSVISNGVGILATDTAEPRIEGNTISDNSDAGIRVDGLGTAAAVQGNTFRDNGTDLDVGLLATATLEANDFEPVAAPTARPLDEVAPDVIERVVDLRELEAMAETPFRTVDRDAAAVELLADLREELESIQADEILFKRIGLLQPDADLTSILEGVVTSEIAGYYRPEEGDIAVIDEDGLLGTEDEWVLAHEYVHALQDQHFDIADRLDAAEPGDAEAALGALVEGDATWLMMVLAMRDAMSSAPEPPEAASVPYDDSSLQALPMVIRRELIFSYLDGMYFAQRVWGRGGWSELDEAYSDPPASTEQILHPTLYPDEQPVPVELPDVAGQLGPGWTSGHESTMGELRTGVLVADDETYELQLLTLTGVTLPNAEAAAGWGGDRIVSLDGPDDRWAVVWQTIWDTPADATEFAEAVAAAMDDLAGDVTVAEGVDITASAPDDEAVLVLVTSDAPTTSEVRAALDLA